MENCKNCGAPKEYVKCAYCKTVSKHSESNKKAVRKMRQFYMEQFSNEIIGNIYENLELIK